MKPTLLLLLMSICIESLSATIFIRGLPAPLEYSNELDLYYWPLNIARPGTPNLFINMDGLDKLCFLDTGPQGTLAQISEISIIINGVKTDWNCFPYKTTVFEVRP